VVALPGIDLAGVMAWEGHAVAIGDAGEKNRVVYEAVGSLVHSAEMCRKAGLEMQIVSCGGSGTYTITARIPGVTEIQAGGAVFTDVAYRTWGVDLEPSLFVLATVTSRPAPTRAIVDAGRKAMNGDVAMPEPRNWKELRLTGLHAEHGLLELQSPNVPLRVGDKVDFVVGYGDNTVFLHDILYGVRNDKVESVWTIQARGRLT
jgi:D-serine deaminase-like pyridoxal phosphate-dependent protein